MDEFKLVVEVLGLQQLDQTMGQVVMDAALADISERIGSLAEQVLSLTAAPGPVHELRRGCWGAGFSLDDQSSMMGMQECLDTITTAAQNLVNEATLATFGAATAVLAAVSVACVEMATIGPGEDIRLTPKTAFDAELQAAVQFIIHRGLIRTMLQPIVRLSDEKVVGVEALSRGPEGSPYERADHLFNAASRSGLTHSLELACAQKALKYMDRLPESLWMSVNSSAEALPDLYRTIALQPNDCSRLIVELTEHLPLGKIKRLRSTLDDFRTSGVRIALDDTGCGYADLEAVENIEADIVKLCITVVRRMDRHEKIRNVIAEAVEKAHFHGTMVLAEGVETAEQARVLRELGVDLAQGWLYGKPFPVTELKAWASGADFANVDEQAVLLAD